MPASGSEIQAIPHAASMTDEDWYASHATQCVEAWGRGKAGAFEHGFVSYENVRPYVTTQTVPAIPANDGLWLLQPSWDAVGKIVTVDNALDNDAAAAGGYRVESQPVASATAGCPAANSPAALQQRRLVGPLRAEFGAWPTGTTGFVLFGGVEKIVTPSPARSGVDSLSSRTSAPVVDDCSDVSPPAGARAPEVVVY